MGNCRPGLFRLISLACLCTQFVHGNRYVFPAHFGAPSLSFLADSQPKRLSENIFSCLDPMADGFFHPVMATRSLCRHPLLCGRFPQSRVGATSLSTQKGKASTLWVILYLCGWWIGGFISAQPQRRPLRAASSGPLRQPWRCLP